MPDMPLSTMTGRFDVIFRLIGAGIIVVGIYLVLQPFLSALLVAGVLAIATGRCTGASMTAWAGGRPGLPP